MDLFDLLLRNTEESDSCHSDQPWTMTTNNTSNPQKNVADDFLDALLHESSSVPASPLWSPCTTDSGINEDPLVDPKESPSQFSYDAFPAFGIPQLPSLENQPQADEKMSDVIIDFGWEPGGVSEDFGIAYYLNTNQNSTAQSTHSVTVKDLLLSNLGQKMQRTSQHSLQELILDEDEKKLLAKEGINLPNKLPLSKFEERVLKKIRRKIRNKRSAQESRKKKREYVDSLEGRMSACSAHNLELQRKIQQLEETNSVLLEQLNQLQALFPKSFSKTANRGTCILVLLLSFSLIISSNLQPGSYNQQNQADYLETKVLSRSLKSTDEVEGLPPPPFPSIPSISRGFEALRSKAVKLWAETDLPSLSPSGTHTQR